SARPDRRESAPAGGMVPGRNRQGSSSGRVLFDHFLPRSRKWSLLIVLKDDIPIIFSSSCRTIFPCPKNPTNYYKKSLYRLLAVK
ncbi:MAG: hypothetical protein PUJ09_00045, partial [Eubacteriales bacterium]|nr:hypothetical protein [Eubacteriales bacterium]